MGSSFALAASSCHQTFLGEEYLITRTVEKSLFVKSRDMYDYRDELHADFYPKLMSLRSDQHWIDMGAGRALPAYDYLKSFKSVKAAADVTAVAWKINRIFGLRSFGGKLESHEGAFELMDTSAWKKADLITDLYGILAYTKDLHTSLQKMVDLLNVNGELYFTHIHFENSVRVNGKPVSIQEFLSSIPGLKVEGQYSELKVTKLVEHVQIPQLVLEAFIEYAPPRRVFRVVE